MEDVNKQRRIFLSLSELECGPQEIISREILLHFTFSANCNKCDRVWKKREFILKVTFSSFINLDCLVKMADYWPLSFVRFYSMIPWVPETFLARFPVSVKSVFSRGFVLRPKICRPSANTENSPAPARKTSATQGNSMTTDLDFVLCPWKRGEKNWPISSLPHGWWLKRMYCAPGAFLTR